jgi:hypothetical protein
MILFNDASLHGQFAAAEPFRESLRILWGIRSLLVSKGLHLKVCRSVRQRKVTPSHTFNDLLGVLPREIKTRLLLWLDREGPFWDDVRGHSDGEYFECCGELVTDTGAAEVAYIQSEGTRSWLFSISPSKFLASPLTVHWRGRVGGDFDIEIPNGWNPDHAEQCVSALERPLSSWNELLDWAARECQHLELSPEILKQLPAQFIPNVANRSQVLLRALNQMVGLLKSEKTQEFNAMRSEWMQGDRARFSPSSESELDDFSKELTFRHSRSSKEVICSWHGKIQTPQYRIHFEWPLPEGQKKLFVAYIGPKITKR